MFKSNTHEQNHVSSLHVLFGAKYITNVKLLHRAHEIKRRKRTIFASLCASFKKDVCGFVSERCVGSQKPEIGIGYSVYCSSNTHAHCLIFETKPASASIATDDNAECVS